MNESFDEQISKLKILLEKNELLQAENLALQIAREHHLELMNNLKQQREQLLELKNILVEQRKIQQDRLRNSLSSD